MKEVFKDVKEDRLTDHNYNTDDVKDIIDHGEMMVSTSMESELEHLSYTQAVIVRQLLIQAEVHGVSLHIDEGELENQKTINDMKKVR